MLIPINTYWYVAENDLVVGTVDNKHDDHCEITICGNNKKGIAYYCSQPLNPADISVGNSYLLRVADLSNPYILIFCKTSDFDESRQPNYAVKSTSAHSNCQNSSSRIKIAKSSSESKLSDDKITTEARTPAFVFCKVTGEQSYGLFAEVANNKYTSKGLLHRSKMAPLVLPEEWINHFGYSWNESNPILVGSYFLAKIDGQRDTNKLSLTQKGIKLTKTRKFIESISNSHVKIYLLGSTGSGKSSLINSILNKDTQSTTIFAPVGYNSDPETQNFHIIRYKFLTLVDTPGLGDAPEKDRTTLREINRLTAADSTNSDEKTVILVIYDAASRDYGATFKLLNILKDNACTDKIIHVLNKIDIFPNVEKTTNSNSPLDAKLESIKNRIECYDSSPVIFPISAGSNETDFEVEEKNVDKLIEAIGVLTNVI